MSTAKSASHASNPTGSTAPTAAVTFPAVGTTLQPAGEELPTTTGQANWTTTRSNSEVEQELIDIGLGAVFYIPNNYREIR